MVLAMEGEMKPSLPSPYTVPSGAMKTMPLFLSSTYLIFFMLAMSGANWYFGIAPMVLSQNPSVLNVNQWYVATKVTLLGHRAEAMNL